MVRPPEGASKQNWTYSQFESLQQREDTFLTVELFAKESIVFGVAGENEFDDPALKSVQRVHATVAARTPHKTEAQVVRSSRPASQSEKSGTSLRQMAKCIPLETSQVWRIQPQVIPEEHREKKWNFWTAEAICGEAAAEKDYDSGCETTVHIQARKKGLLEFG